MSLFSASQSFGQRPMEYLDRALVGLEVSNGVFLSWRMLGTDDPDIGFNLYRNGTKITSSPITTSTNYVDAQGKATDKYKVETIVTGGDNEFSDEITVWPRTGATATTGKAWIARKEIPLPAPPTDEGATYVPGDMSVGDLDGDGDYELIFEWEGPVPYLEAVDLEGNSFWRIKCGPNTTKAKLAILVFDFDGDGKAEVACKTGPGTIDGQGNHLSKGPAAVDDNDHILERSWGGHIIEDDAYITVFEGKTGAELATTPYWPQIGPQATMQDTWGDNHGYRAASIKAAILRHKELGPLMVFARGIYTRIAMGALKFDGKKLELVWTFDTENGYSGYRGQGNHSVAVGDVDGDGSDELMYGAAAIDHDGTGLYNTNRGHGDSHAIADHDPDHPGLEYYQGHENGTYGISMRDAGTGEILWEVLSESDVGRAWAADVNPSYRGSEVISISTEDRDCKGNIIPTNYNSYHQPVYFDGNIERELRSGASVNGASGRIFTGWYYGATTIHYTKEDANLVADIIGDWREEIILPRNDNKALVMFSTWFPTERKNYTLMHDPTYRMNVAVQSIGYNQPAHVGYYFPDGAPTPDIKLVKYDPTAVVEKPDTTTPVIVTPNNVLQPIDAECVAYLPDLSEILEVNDPDHAEFYFSQTPAIGTLIGEIGEKLNVSVIVNDGYGNNSKEVSFDVTAVDATAPIITKAFADHTLQPSSGCTRAIPDYTKYVTAEDFCTSELTITMQPAAGTLLSGDNDSVAVTLTFDDNSGNTTDTTFTVTLVAPGCDVASVNNLNGQTIRIYPNPVEDFAYLNLPGSTSGSYSIEIFDMAGLKVYAKETNKQQIAINMQAFTSGLYMVRVNGNTTSYQECIIKK